MKRWFSSGLLLLVLFAAHALFSERQQARASESAPEQDTPLVCKQSGGTGGLPAGSHDVVIAGQPAHIIVSPNYDPKTPTYLAYYLHGDEGNYLAHQSPYSAVRQFVEAAGWIHVSAQALPSPLDNGTRWYGDGTRSDLMDRNGELLHNILQDMFANYNVCTRILFASSASGGSWFYDYYFFPTYGGRYPTFININCGAAALDSRKPFYNKAVELSEYPEVITRSEFHYTIGTADFLYDEFQISSETYRDLGFTVSTDILEGVGHCEFGLGAKTTEYWEQKWSSILESSSSPLLTRKITAKSGDNQMVYLYGSAQQPLVATVSDAEGLPLANVVVKVKNYPDVVNQPDRHSVSYLQTNEVGDVSYKLPAVNSVGDGKVVASIFPLDTLSTTFTYRTSRMPYWITISSGDSQETTIEQEYSLPLIVEVVDENKIPIPSIPVTFEVESGLSGEEVVLSEAVVLTDKDGKASVTARAGNLAGTVYVAAFTATRKLFPSIISTEFRLTIVDPNATPQPTSQPTSSPTTRPSPEPTSEPPQGTPTPPHVIRLPAIRP